MNTKLISNKCMQCGEDDPRVLKEEHHIFGRANSPETIILCHNCHDKITHDQNKLPPKVRKRSATPEDKQALEDVTTGSYLELIGKRIKKRGMEKYG